MSDVVPHELTKPIHVTVIREVCGTFLLKIAFYSREEEENVEREHQYDQVGMAQGAQQLRCVKEKSCRRLCGLAHMKSVDDVGWPLP